MSGTFALNATPEERALAAAVADMMPEPLTPADSLAFNLLTAKVAEWVALNHVIRDKGTSEINRRSGETHLTADARRESDVFAEIVTLCKEFGLTPMSRARLAARTGKATPDAVSPVFKGFISVDPGKADE